MQAVLAVSQHSYYDWRLLILVGFLVLGVLRYRRYRGRK
jgi:hypothetical protein